MNDQSDDTPTGPQDDPFRSLIEKRQQMVDDHTALRAGQPYKGTVRQLKRLAADYVLALTMIDLMATRWPPFFDSLVTLRVKPHLVQSLTAAFSMAGEGALDPARRELRFLIEASVKTLWLGKSGPHNDQTKLDGANSGRSLDVADKVVALDDLGRKRFGEIVASLQFGLLDEEGAGTYRRTATDLYSKLSTFNHMTSGNVVRDFANFDRDRGFGFETVAEIDAFARLAKRVLDLALASHFEAFDPALVGDILVNLSKDWPRWKFRKTPLVGIIDRHFDYKLERKKS